MAWFLVETPEDIQFVYGSSSNSVTFRQAVTPKALRLALVLNDYHDNVHFHEREPVRVRRLTREEWLRMLEILDPGSEPWVGPEPDPAPDATP